MRIRILKAFYWKDRDVATTPGQVMNVPETKAVLAVPEPKPAVTRKPRKVKRTGK